MVLPRTLAKFNRRVTNRVVGPAAGHVPGLGIVVHRGRRSGRVYRTPVTLFESANGYRIALTYGVDVDWLKNITAAGEFDLETHGRTVHLTGPEIVRDPTAAWAPIGVRQALTTLSADHYVQARRVAAE